MIVLTALCLVVLLGFVGIAIDVGLLFRAKQNVRIAADAAAIAGALDLGYGLSPTTGALNAAAANGITDPTQVVVNNPPLHGSHFGSGYVEVIITQPNPTFFMQLFQFTSMNVAARAVAGTSGPGPACIYALGGVGITGSGTGSISVPGCDIDVNGGITLSGTTTIAANKVRIVGAYTHSGLSSVTPAPVRFSGATDPLASLVQPTPTACTNLTTPFPNPVTPGCYNSITVSGNKTINLSPGTYVINGSITASGTLTITGSGVTLFLTGGIVGSGNVGLNLVAPTSGPYNGIALWISRTSSTGITLSGTTTTNFQGIIYAPNSDLTVSGSTPLNLTSDLIVRNMTFSGTTSIQNYAAINTSTHLGSGSGSGTFALVE